LICSCVFVDDLPGVSHSVNVFHDGIAGET